MTKEQKNDVVRDYDSGMRVADIGTKHDISSTFVYIILKEFGYKPNRQEKFEENPLCACGDEKYWPPARNRPYKYCYDCCKKHYTTSGFANNPYSKSSLQLSEVFRNVLSYPGTSWVTSESLGCTVVPKQDGQYTKKRRSNYALNGMWV